MLEDQSMEKKMVGDKVYMGGRDKNVGMAFYLIWYDNEGNKRTRGWEEREKKSKRKFNKVWEVKDVVN